MDGDRSEIKKYFGNNATCVSPFRKIEYQSPVTCTSILLQCCLERIEIIAVNNYVPGCSIHIINIYTAERQVSIPSDVCKSVKRTISAPSIHIKFFQITKHSPLFCDRFLSQ